MGFSSFILQEGLKSKDYERSLTLKIVVKYSDGQSDV